MSTRSLLESVTVAGPPRTGAWHQEVGHTEETWTYTETKNLLVLSSAARNCLQFNIFARHYFPVSRDLAGV